MSAPIVENLARIQTRLEAACERAGRAADEVALIAVSKRKPAEDVLSALQAGQLLFGENRVQEAREKIPTVGQPDGKVPQWHLIGSLQKNKVKYLPGLVQMVQTIDSVELAQALGQRMVAADGVMPILVQVNVGGEEQKNGLAPDDLEEVVSAIAEVEGVELQGLMTVPPIAEDPEKVRPYFRALRLLSEHITRMRLPGVTMRHLSMGMSHDFEVAIEEGATMVRVGSALFGPRDT
uniref:Pyridoxal phosphate homeostasis protein n=1 Tax=Magnetococcus massalia (strain MO-1) TaxID=451514 RepID=A0A1S7LL95_MAGMO|nr:conserved protein of unknown function [Candidatus Magnetococcus massalia]